MPSKPWHSSASATAWTTATWIALTGSKRSWFSVMRQLQDSGSLTDFDKLQNLIGVAQKDVVVSEGWGEEQFRRIAALAGGHLQFRTLPVLRYDTVDGQDVNIIDPTAIKAQVTGAFDRDLADVTSTAPTAPSSTVDVMNAGSTPGLAATVSDALHARGYAIGAVGNAVGGEFTSTAVDEGPGAETDAQNLTALLGINGQPRADATMAVGHVRITLGDGYQLPDAFLDTIATPVGDTSGGTATSADGPDPGQPITGEHVPCVN